jgi:hypothetical protein
VPDRIGGRRKQNVHYIYYLAVKKFVIFNGYHMKKKKVPVGLFRKLQWMRQQVMAGSIQMKKKITGTN